MTFKNVTKNAPNVPSWWDGFIETLNKGDNIPHRVRDYLDAGAAIASDSQCIRAERVSDKLRIPSISIGPLPNGGTGRRKASIRVLLYLGAFERLARLEQLPMCRHKDCVNPYHQVESQKFNSGPLDPPLYSTLDIPRYTWQATKVTDIVPPPSFDPWAKKCEAAE